MVPDEKVGVSHVLKKVLSIINGFFSNIVLIPSGYLECSVFDKLLGFIGWLLLNPLTFVGYPLWVIGRRFKVMFLFPANPRFDPFESP